MPRFLIYANCAFINRSNVLFALQIEVKQCFLYFTRSSHADSLFTNKRSQKLCHLNKFHLESSKFLHSVLSQNSND